MARRLDGHCSDLRGQSLDEWNRERAGDPRLGCEGAGVKGGARADRRDHLGVGCRYDIGAGARCGQRALEARHGRKVALVGDRRGTALVRKDELEAQNSKNTVSLRPCNATFHSSAPSPALLATSVARRSGGTRPSTGQSALEG